MKCPHCAKSLIQKLSDTVSKLRLSGPITADTQAHHIRSSCYWCARPVQLTAFFPDVQPQIPTPSAPEVP